VYRQCGGVHPAGEEAVRLQDPFGIVGAVRNTRDADPAAHVPGVQYYD
jgi:hypothetical protein